MKIRELLKLIDRISKEEGTSEPFIVGGVPRDKAMGRIEEIQDIDLTTGDDSIKRLADAVNRVLVANYPDVNMKTFPDGHSQINMNGMKVDFSSNFNSPQIKELLNRAGVDNPDSMTKELMSRDFTVNSLLLGMDLSTIKDPTGSGIKDLKSGILKTPLPPHITLGNDPKRIPRIIYIATKLGLEVEKPIIEFVSKNPQLLDGVKDRYIADKIHSSLDKDSDKTVKLITDMNLWNSIPITERLRPYAMGRV